MRIAVGKPVRISCASCAGEVCFSPKEQALVCQSCGRVFGFDSTLPAEETAVKAAEARVGTCWGIHKKEVTCSSCGAKRAENELLLAGVCPYCGAHYVLAEAEDPDGVVPFALSRRQAQESLSAWLNQKLLAPRTLKKRDFSAQFAGIYVPCWTFDAQTATLYRGRYGIRRGGRIEWQTCAGVYNAFVNDALLEAGKKRGGEWTQLFEGLAPFETEKNQRYDARLLLGFSAQRCQRGAADSWHRAKDKISRELDETVRRHIKEKHDAAFVQAETSTAYQNITCKYLLVPVWLLEVSYAGGRYTMAVNGQTGKVSGRAPVSGGKIGAAIAAFLFLILLLFWL